MNVWVDGVLQSCLNLLKGRSCVYMQGGLKCLPDWKAPSRTGFCPAAGRGEPEGFAWEPPAQFFGVPSVAAERKSMHPGAQTLAFCFCFFFPANIPEAQASRGREENGNGPRRGTVKRHRAPQDVAGALAVPHPCRYINTARRRSPLAPPARFWGDYSWELDRRTPAPGLDIWEATSDRICGEQSEKQGDG